MSTVDELIAARDADRCDYDCLEAWRCSQDAEFRLEWAEGEERKIGNMCDDHLHVTLIGALFDGPGSPRAAVVVTRLKP